MRYVYKLQNLVNGKVYVGQTMNPANRKAGHFYDARRGDKRPLYASIRKHGVENFLFEVIEECADELINEREQHWVAYFDSFNREKGYNLTSGGEEGKIFSQESKEKIRQKAIGRVLPIDVRQRIGRASKQAWKDGRMHAPPNTTGYIHTDEAKRKIGAANSIRQLGVKNSQFGKIWMSNENLRCSRRVHYDELDTFLKQGWVKGRKMKW